MNPLSCGRAASYGLEKLITRAGSFGKTSSSNGPTSMQKPAFTIFQRQHVEHSPWLLETFMVEIAGNVMSWQNQKAPSYTAAICSCLSKARTLNQPCMTGSGTVYKQLYCTQSPRFNAKVQTASQACEKQDQVQPSSLLRYRIRRATKPSRFQFQESCRSNPSSARGLHEVSNGFLELHLWR